MLTNDQKKLLKMAQRDAGLADAEYREAISMVTKLDACTSSTDPRLTDEHFDNLMKYFEAIFWHRNAAPQSKVFRAPGYWAGKNQKGNTSRDRFTGTDINTEITALERHLATLGYNHYYCRSIRNRVIKNAASPTPNDLVKYRSALERTIKAKQNKAEPVPESVDQPF